MDKVKIIAGKDEIYRNELYLADWYYQEDYKKDNYSMLEIKKKATVGDVVEAMLYISKDIEHGMYVSKANKILDLFGFEIVEEVEESVVIDNKQMTLKEIADDVENMPKKEIGRVLDAILEPNKAPKGTPIPNTEFKLGERVFIRGEVRKILGYNSTCKVGCEEIHVSANNVLQDNLTLSSYPSIKYYKDTVNFLGVDLSEIKKLPTIGVGDTIKVKSKKKVREVYKEENVTANKELLSLCGKEFIVEEINKHLDTKETFFKVNGILISEDYAWISEDCVKLVKIS